MVMQLGASRKTGAELMLSKLFEPIRIGTLQLKNRIVMAPMVVLFGSDTGAVSQRQIDYYVERAKGGVGLITVEPSCVTRGPTWGWGGQYINSDRFIPMYNELVESIHLFGDGCKVSIQLHSPGRQTILEMTEGEKPVSASAIEGIEPDVVTRQLDTEEIDEFVEAYAEGARRAKDAGFDAVNIEGACGYLVNQFLSPLYNKRTDQYGRSLQNRLRFAVRIVRRIKEKVGKDFPVIFELNCNEFIEGGITIEESKIMAQKLERAGVDAFRIHRGSYEAYRYIIPPACLPRGCFVNLAAEIKGAITRAKVQAEGRINNPELAEEILQSNKADLIGFGRAFLADPQWPEKAASGQIDDIRKCLACNRCIERIFKSFPAKCTVNAALGREKEYSLSCDERSKKVVIVGAGPAGMEAARVASIRGHKVTIFEKNKKLGGQLNLACVSPHKEETLNIIEYLTQQMIKLRVDIRLEEATQGKIEEAGPDVVVIATGATPFVPKIRGADGRAVFSAWDILANKIEVPDKVVVVGGGMVGCETAEYLASKGKNVTILEMKSEIANDVEPYTRSFLLERLSKYGVRTLTDAKLEKIIESGVIYLKNSVRNTSEADAIVLALGTVSNRDLVSEIKGKVPNSYIIGDCLEPSDLLHAIHTGFHTGRLI